MYTDNGENIRSMKNKLFLFLVCMLICNTLFSQESAKIVEVLSGRTETTIFSLEDIDYVNIYGLIIMTWKNISFLGILCQQENKEMPIKSAYIDFLI